jgi:5S rRNA maturation endonuclease (ribonuclease M5)
MVVAVEGRTDRQYLEWFLSYYHSDDHLWPLLRKSEILDYDGISPLQSFIQSNYEYIRRESVFVALFDSDQAGNRAREALQSIFGRKGGYRANEDFVALRWGYSIEGVFSDDLIKMVQTGKGSLFTNYSEDAEGLILPFGIRDGKKMEVFERLTKRAEEEKGFEWAGRFIMLCSALERALEYQCRRLERSAG